MDVPERSGPRRGTSLLSAAQMTKGLQSYAQEAGVRQEFSMHSFRTLPKHWRVKLGIQNAAGVLEPPQHCTAVHMFDAGGVTRLRITEYS